MNIFHIWKWLIIRYETVPNSNQLSQQSTLNKKKDENKKECKKASIFPCTNDSHTCLDGERILQQ